MLEKWKGGTNNEEYVSALFMDHLSRAFDTINHNRIAKLKAYGFSTNALKLLHSYLKNRKQIKQSSN